MIKHSGLEERRKKIPMDIKISMDLSFETVRRIQGILKRQNKSQKDLANLLHKKESEISKWMRGTHNFTYSTIAKIEAVLGERIIDIVGSEAKKERDLSISIYLGNAEAEFFISKPTVFTINTLLEEMSKEMKKKQEKEYSLGASGTGHINLNEPELFYN